MAPPVYRGRPGGRLLTPLLLIVGSLLTACLIVAGWAQWQLFDDGAWGDTSQRMLERKEIRNRVASYLVDEVRAQSGGALPTALGTRPDRTVSRELSTPRSEHVWRASTTEAHRELVRLIKDDGAVSGDVVTLDLRPLIRAVARELGLPLPVLSGSAARVQIVAGDQVRGARKVTGRLQRTAAILLIVAPLVLWLAVLAARGWRARALAGAGVAVAVAGAVVLGARALVGAHVVDVLTSSEANRDAVSAAWSVGTSKLAWMAVAAVVVGLVVAVAASIAARAPRPRYS